MPKIVVPRLKRLRVEGYELYPDHPDLGVFEHVFVPGVNVVIGINGLGKTTLLNLMFRLMVGPYDPSKADRIRPGRKQASIKYANVDFFRERVVDRAETAKGTAVFAFGDVEVEVTRSLKDLRLISYRHEGVLHEAGIPARDLDDGLMALLCRLAGLDTDPAPDEGREDDGGELPAYRYDFDFLIRNLVFFLEDKVPLIWNPEGQFVILRILLVEERLSKRIALARNELLRIDSIYRNRLWAKNSLAERIRVGLAEMEEQGVALEQRDLVVSQLGGLDARAEDLEGELTRLKSDVQKIDAQLLRTRADVFDREVAVRDEEAVYFHAAFAKARPPGDLIVRSMAGHQGCLVCGNRDEAAHRRARERMERHCCPVCESDVAVPEGASGLVEARGDRLAETERRLVEGRRRHEALVASSDNARRELEATLDALGETRAQRRELRAMVASVDDADRERSEIERMRAELADREGEVNRLDVDFQVAQREHENLIRAAQDDVARFRDDIIEAFDGYAKAFMVDDCRLRFMTDRRGKIAQADRMIDWPAFWVELSSGEGTSLTEREASEEVSESQKEFIDLAFRMALLRAACRGEPSMLVVETPEASLDAVFMRRAGELLREYGRTDERNVLVVSSNLTSASMIPALLGVGEEGAEDLDARMRRVIDLLRRARPTKALNRNRDDYEEAFRIAVGDDRAEAASAVRPPASPGRGATA